MQLAKTCKTAMQNRLRLTSMHVLPDLSKMIDGLPQIVDFKVLNELGALFTFCFTFDESLHGSF